MGMGSWIASFQQIRSMLVMPRHRFLNYFLLYVRVCVLLGDHPDCHMPFLFPFTVPPLMLSSPPWSYTPWKRGWDGKERLWTMNEYACLISNHDSSLLLFLLSLILPFFAHFLFLSTFSRYNGFWFRSTNRRHCCLIILFAPLFSFAVFCLSTFDITNHYIICCVLICKIASPVFSPHQVLEGVRFQVWPTKSLWGGGTTS